VIERHHNELERKSDTAIFFGCGPSINDITEDDWGVLKKYDSWAINFFLYHDFIVPDFYYRGCGKTDKFFDKFKDHWNNKREGPYKDTKFITKADHKGKISRMNIDEVYIVRLHHSWKQALRSVGERALGSIGNYEQLLHKHALANFRILDNSIYFYGRATLCFILVLMYQMGYKEIIIYGNDLNSKLYFWSDRDRKDIHWQWAKQTLKCKARKKSGPHPNIISVTTFIPWFNEKYMNNRIFVGSKKTLLFPDMPYKSIEELK
jgi:hypothetical protein